MVAALLIAAAPAADVLLCETEPPEPGLKIRTEMLLLLGLVSVGFAVDLADCPVSAVWSTPWTVCAWATPDPRASSTASAPMSAIRCRFTTGFPSIDIERYHRAISRPVPGFAVPRRD